MFAHPERDACYALEAAKNNHTTPSVISITPFSQGRSLACSENSLWLSFGLPLSFLPTSSVSSRSSCRRREIRGVRRRICREDVGVLFHFAAPDDEDGGGDSAVLRGSGCSKIYALLRRLCLVLLALYHHPRPRRHIDGPISHLITYHFSFRRSP